MNFVILLLLMYKVSLVSLLQKSKPPNFKRHQKSKAPFINYNRSRDPDISVRGHPHPNHFQTPSARSSPRPSAPPTSRRPCLLPIQLLLPRLSLHPLEDTVGVMRMRRERRRRSSVWTCPATSQWSGWRGTGRSAGPSSSSSARRGPRMSVMT